MLREHGFSTEGRVIPTARLLALGETEQEAVDVARAGATWTVMSYSTPDRVTDTIVELRETIGLDYLMCAPLSHKTFTLFTEKVLPKHSASS